MSSLTDGPAGREDHSGEPVRSPVDILVVDDNPAKLLAVATALAPLGERVVTAVSGREALRQLLEGDFATVLLDVHMPDLDGFETAQMIRSRKRSSSTPIIFTSSVNMDETDVAKGYALGAVDYICAPLIPEVLQAKVAVFVQLHRKSIEVRQHAERLEQRTRELERSRNELRLSERMASVGTLCAGLGHDMGNLLLPLSIWIDQVERTDSPELAAGIRPLRTCVQYLRRLAAGLRLVSLDPSQESGSSRVVLDDWLGEISPVLKNTLPPRATMEVDVPPGLPPVAIAPHRLAQVVFNLFQNAGEAMGNPASGVVKFSAASSAGTNSVRFGVSDNGPGMSPEVLERCLDPFFTTKTRGISTGLGLALVHGILQRCGATLHVESTLGRGTAFTFELPVVKESTEPGAWAIVSIADARMRSVVAALLRTCAVEVVQDVPGMDGRAAMIVADQSREGEDRSREFLSSVPGGCCFVLSDMLSNEQDGFPSGSIVRVASPLDLSKAVAEFVATSEARHRGHLCPVGE